MGTSPTVNNVRNLPSGELYRTTEGSIVVLKNQKKSIAIWKLSNYANRVWLLSTEDALDGSGILQVRRKLEEQNIIIEHKITVQEGVITSLYESSDKKEEDEETSGKIKEESYVVKKFYAIMKIVVQEGASDVHIEKRNDQASIKIRKNGEVISLPGYETMSPKEAVDLCSVIYNVLAENDSKEVAFNGGLIQQGAVKISVSVKKDTEEEIKLRYQSVPVYPNGFDVIMRVLPIGSKDNEFTSLEKLGYESSHIKMIFECVGKAVGSLVIAGVTGSGKSTTLKNIIMQINKDRGFSEKIFTVEDPPEYIIPGVSQIPVARRRDDVKEGRTPFEDAIKACMRGDPDVIMVGEIRDGATGDLLKKAVQSGHRVLTTVHAPSALGVIDRLLDFNITTSTLSSQEFIAGLIYQKLLGINCNFCSKALVDEIAPAKAHKNLIELYKRIEKLLTDGGESDKQKYLDKVRLRGSGCSKCENGITGRTVCAEVVKPDLKILECIQKKDMLGALRHLRNDISDKLVTSKNMVGKSAMAHAIIKMLNGEIDPTEVERSFGVISLDEVRGIPQVRAEDYKDDLFNVSS